MLNRSQCNIRLVGLCAVKYENMKSGRMKHYLVITRVQTFLIKKQLYIKAKIKHTCYIVVFGLPIKCQILLLTKIFCSKMRANMRKYNKQIRNQIQVSNELLDWLRAYALQVVGYTITIVVNCSLANSHQPHSQY